MNKEETQHQPETAAEAAVHKYFDGSRVLDAAGEAEGGVVRKAAGNTRGRREEQEDTDDGRGAAAGAALVEVAEAECDVWLWAGDMTLGEKQHSGAKGGDEGGWEEEEGVLEGMQQEVQLGFSAPGDRG